jgi:hypothetical protein
MLTRMLLPMAFLVLVALVTGCSPGAESPPSDPLAQMEIAFIDYPSRKEIKPLLDNVTPL